MTKFDSLMLALEYIESHLCSELNMQSLAKHAFSSLSGLQKQFRWVFNYSIKEYVSKRRLTVAARELVETNHTILETALKYGYQSAETFTRAFHKMYGVTPSEYRRQKSYVAVFPRIQIEQTENGEFAVYKDVSALYDWLKHNDRAYAVCFDIVGLMGINAISRDAGDAVLIAAIRRMIHAKEPSMPIFRLGGDEFAVLVPDGSPEYCLKLEHRVMEQNGIPVEYNGKEYPVILRSWVGKVPDLASYRELSATLIHNVKNTES